MECKPQQKYQHKLANMIKKYDKKNYLSKNDQTPTPKKNGKSIRNVSPLEL